MSKSSLPTIVAIPSTSKDVDDKADHRFARAQYYTIYNHKDLSFNVIENEAKNESSGAGNKASRQLSKLGVEAVLVPEIGPKAWETLHAFDIKVYRYHEGSSVRNALYQLYEHKLEEITGATKEGHR
jgi:predicted Fe-Mo cluster-binding NifX family protein